MAVKQIAEADSNQTEEKRVKISGGEGAGADCDRNNERINKDACEIKTMHGKVKRKRFEESDDDDLSDIEDREVSGYLNNKEETNYKKFLWEAMYGNYTQTKKQKQRRKVKKGVSVNKDARAKEVEPKKPISKLVNYEALKLLCDELDQVSEAGQIANTDTARTEGGSNGNDYYQNAESNENFNDFDLYNDQGDHENCYDDEYFDF